MGLSLKDIYDLSEDAQKQIIEKLGRQKRTNKYHAEADQRGGITFHSKKEARRYDELMLRLRAGRIQDLKLQPQFTLQESYVRPDGTRVRAIRYVADFSYFDCDRDMDVVEDVKSRATATAQYKIKKKLMLERKNIEIEEI